MGKRLIELNLLQAIRIVLVVFLPEVAMKFKIGVLDKEVTRFFEQLTKDIVDQRKKTKTVRKDFMQLLIELKEKGSVAIDDDDEDKHLKEEDDHQSKEPFRFNDIDLAAQATIFFLAGFETSSTVMSFALLELAVNPDIQRKAQLEIDEQLVQCGGKITYETLKKMEYLEWILQESMRKYPPVAVHSRVCTKKYTMPDTNVSLEKGIIVTIPNHALQNDPKFFPNPDRFDPERFSEDDILRKNQYIYSPFGEGPRQCIGNRFAMVQSKLALLTFLRKYTISTCEKTQFPVQFDATQFIITAKAGVWLKIQKRE
ncbi:cytochrome P450 3A19-like [Cloeon dipterum]|uniref:cytochrome P450 3A19-like n=1 Tax=Cloeon dipterum TaxID=197152 RepID=UPI00321FB900